MWVLLDRERRLEENLAPAPFDLRRVLREVLIVPETKPASELLVELRNHRVGMALVVDEFWQHPWTRDAGRYSRAGRRRRFTMSSTLSNARKSLPTARLSSTRR